MAPKRTEKPAHLKNEKKYRVKDKTLVDSLERRAVERNEFVHLMDIKNNPTRVTARDILDNGQKVAQYLLSRGLVKNDKVLIMLPTSTDFMYVYFGILMAGGVPVPVSQPAGTSNIEKYLENLKHIIRDSESKFFISYDKIKMIVAGLMKRNDIVSDFIFTNDMWQNTVDSNLFRPLPSLDADDLALIQYTSGTTGHPKGVMLSHKNLIHNIHGIGLGTNLQESDAGISWLPMYHDMGLIGGFLTLMYWNNPVVTMMPEAFILRPQWWMENITNYGVSIGVAPNFGYHYCVTRIPDSVVEKLDLSTWRLALNGAEPVDRITLQKFIEKFRPAGLRDDIFFPVYGMAENSLAATFPALDNTTVVRRFVRKRLEEEHVAIDSDSRDTKKYIDLVAVGSPLVGQEVRIGDENGKTMKERQVGQILVKSPSLTSGYYKNEKASRETIREGWLNTGDMGFVLDGLLFISGRKKEIIIKRGKNIYPYDVERIASTVKGVRLGCCAAFAVENAEKGTEDLVLVCETTIKDARGQEEQVKQINAEVLAKLGISLDDVLLVPKNTIPKTTSGKIQRIMSKKIYLEDDFMEMKRRNAFVLVKTMVVSFIQIIKMELGKLKNRVAGSK